MPTSRRPPKPVIIAVVLALVAGGIFAWWWFTQPSTAEAARDATGTVEAGTYDVAAVIAGRVTGIYATEGARVNQGDTLITLDDSALKLQVEQAQEGVNAAKAAVTQAGDDGAAAVTAARAKLKQAEAGLQLARVQLGSARITAPHAGIVVTLATNAGQAAAPGRTLITLIDPADLFVRAYVPEPKLGEVKIGGGAIATSAGTDYRGSVTFVATEAQFTPNNVETTEQRSKLVFEVRVKLAADSGTLKPGMPVDVRFE